MSPPSCLPKSEKTLEEEVRIAEEELERARSLRNRHTVVYEEANQRIREYDDQFYHAQQLLKKKRELLVQELDKKKRESLEAQKKLEAELATKKKELVSKMKQDSDAKKKQFQAQLKEQELLLAKKRKEMETKMNKETDAKKNEVQAQLKEEELRLA
ncbi:hypothetical protein A2U01_0028041, partial [Trifolium medium]|nr:hypothetical protein [Trifolium medium]